MTDLERIEIEGFKGIESISFEPTDINLITGRNNTGKTSFLEAVDLLFTPSGLKRFKGNIDTVINVNHENSNILAETANGTFEVHLRNPSDEELLQYVTQAVVSVLEVPSTFFSSLTEDGSAAIVEIFDVQTEVRQVLERDVKEGTLRKLKTEIFVLSTSEEDYPYYVPGKGTSEVMPIVYEIIETKFSKEFDSNGENIPNEVKSLLDNFGNSDRTYSEIVSSMIEKLTDSPEEQFLRVPKNEAVSKFIESVDLTEDIEILDEKKDPIKIDDISDYIVTKKLVDGLKTFTTDYLIFEKEDGEKYDIPYDFMGDGFKSIVGLLWELMDDEVENEVVLIEEPETHMHPGYVSELVHFLIDLARDENIQFFITTHDHDFIKDFFAEMPEEKREYLEEEFSLVKMDDFGANVLDYDDAEHHLKDLHLDLRGI